VAKKDNLSILYIEKYQFGSLKFKKKNWKLMYQSPTHSMLRHVCRAKQAVFFLPSKEMSVSKDPPTQTYLLQWVGERG
jgi:hypothetical protein